jgi:hypothetical protein
MATKKPKKGETKLEKAESVAPLPVGSMLSAERGQPRIATSSFFIQNQKRKELAMPTRLCTFDTMYEDDAVYTSIDITNLHVVNALYNGEFKAKTPKGQVAADFLNYCIRNMTSGTWLDTCMNAVTDLQFGWSTLNIVTEKRNFGQFKGARCLKKLSPRDQKSVYGWLWDKNFREVEGFVQRPLLTQTRKFDVSGGFNNGISALSTGKLYESNYPIIRKNQLLWFRYNTTNSNPEGNSPLLHCWGAWKEKQLIERYEVVGVSKDLGGAVVLRVPSELLNRAQDSSNYPADAASLAALQSNAKALHAGESSYLLMSSDVDETTKTPLYDFKLQGIDGSGKQYNTSDIIERKNTSIYNTFGTGFLLLGQSSEGSYSLSTNAVSTHSHYVNRNILQKVDVLNTQLAPRLLKINGIELDWKDMPKFVADDPNELDLDIAGKFIQRVKSVGGLTEKALEFIYERANLPIDGIDQLVFDDDPSSRAGESQGSSGTGNTQQGGRSSTTNSENGGDVAKKLVVDGDRIIDTETDKVINIEDLNEEGNYK